MMSKLIESLNDKLNSLNEELEELYSREERLRDIKNLTRSTLLTEVKRNIKTNGICAGETWRVRGVGSETAVISRVNGDDGWLGGYSIKFQGISGTHSLYALMYKVDTDGT